MNKLLGFFIVVGAANAVAWNQSRLDRNDAMRQIPKEIEEALKHFDSKPTFTELKGHLEFFEIYAKSGIFFETHHKEFVAELDKQIKMASNG